MSIHLYSIGGILVDCFLKRPESPEERPADNKHNTHWRLPAVMPLPSLIAPKQLFCISLFQLTVNEPRDLAKPLWRSSWSCKVSVNRIQRAQELGCLKKKKEKKINFYFMLASNRHRTFLLIIDVGYPLVVAIHMTVTNKVIDIFISHYSWC